VQATAGYVQWLAPKLDKMSAGLMFILGLLCAGCQSTIQIVTPMVIQGSTTGHNEELILSASVQNYSAATSPDLWLGVYSEYWPNCTAAGFRPHSIAAAATITMGTMNNPTMINHSTDPSC
jgi:hypothetical protein